MKWAVLVLMLVPLVAAETVSVDSTYPGYGTAALIDGVVDAGGMEASTWASAESAVDPHWVVIEYDTAQLVSRADVYWALNGGTYMASQALLVQFWNGTDYVTLTTLSGGAGPQSTASFSPVNTSRLRLFQPTNQGAVSYPGIMWITEVSTVATCDSADADGDGSVDGGDLALVAHGFGDASGSADRNRDGRVDVFDLVHVIRRWGYQCPEPVQAPVVTGNAFFTDDFEPYTAGTNGHEFPRENFSWGGGRYIEISDDIALSGSQSLKFLYGPFEPDGSTHMWGEQRFVHKPLTEYWVEYYAYHPDGTEGFSARYAHAPNGMNNKFYSFWGHAYSDVPSGTLSTWGISGTNDSQIGFVSLGNDTWSESQIEPFIVGDADRGRWMHVQVHIKVPDICVHNGEYRLWKDGLLLIEETNEYCQQLDPLLNYLDHGYIYGYDNANYVENTSLYIDDFRIYDSDPGWLDLTPPNRTSGSPTSTLGAGTTNTTLSISTDENATCRYAAAAATAYASMTPMDASGGTSHSTLVSGLADGGSYTYYVRCQDLAGNTNGDDYSISFDVAVEAYPNLPSGYFTIGQADGTVIESGGSAFGISDFGGWGADYNITVVDDPTNPSGSGQSLLFTYETDAHAGIATADTFAGGPYKELYVMSRLFLEPGYHDEAGGKFFYLGADADDRVNAGSPTQFYNTGDGGRLRWINQNAGTTEAEVMDSGEAPPKGTNSNPLPTGEWLSIEHRFVASSAPGVADGEAYLYVNGELAGFRTGVDWNTDGFTGMEWYGHFSGTLVNPRQYRLGELYIAGAPRDPHPNEPTGLTTLMQADGSVAEAGGSAFGIAGWSPWYYVGSSYDPSRISVVSDAGNPTGSASAVRRWWRNQTPSGATDNVGAGTADFTYPGGPYDEVYVAMRLVHRGGEPTNHKWYYHIMQDNDVGSAGGAWPTLEGSEEVQLSSCGENVIPYTSVPGIYATDQEFLYEWYWVAESSHGAGDGQVYYWINGALIGSASNATFSCYTSAPERQFKGLHYYGQANALRAGEFYEDIRELYVSVR